MMAQYHIDGMTTNRFVNGTREQADAEFERLLAFDRQRAVSGTMTLYEIIDDRPGLEDNRVKLREEPLVPTPWRRPWRREVDPDTEYRAAYVADCVLTGREHQHLSDSDLLAEAVAEAARQGLIGPDEHQIRPDQIRIGIWRGRRQS